MEYYKRGDIIGEILKIPVETLEERIKEIENEIKERERIRNEIIEEIEHEKRKLEEKIRKLYYFEFMNPALAHTRAMFEMEILQLEKAKQREITEAFRDLLIIKKELRDLKEKLKKEKKKLKLIF